MSWPRPDTVARSPQLGLPSESSLTMLGTKKCTVGTPSRGPHNSRPGIFPLHKVWCTRDKLPALRCSTALCSFPWCRHLGNSYNTSDLHTLLLLSEPGRCNKLGLRTRLLVIVPASFRRNVCDLRTSVRRRLVLRPRSPIQP